MNWHRFLVALPFSLFMFLFFNGLGWAGAGRITKRNVLISLAGAVGYQLLTMVP